MDPAAMQAKIMELEASLVTATSALQQLSIQQAVHSAPKPPKQPKPDKFQGDRRSGAASNWLHQMTLYLTLSGLLGTAQAVPHAVSFLIGAARTWWRTQEASGSPPTTWTTFKAVASLTTYGGRWALRRCSKVSGNVGEVPVCYIYSHIIMI
eukprot:jgi/Astpho2/1768/fgenesh1_pg.00033_%23_1_t